MAEEKFRNENTRVALIRNFGEAYFNHYGFKETLKSKKVRKYLDQKTVEIKAENPGSKIVEIRKANILDFKAEKNSLLSKIFLRK